MAQIRSYMSTLAAKAQLYTARAQVLARYRFIAAVGLRKYGDRSLDSLMKHDGDNDGLWTGMFVAAQAFRYAATRAEDARTLAWKYFSAVEFLHNVTGRSLMWAVGTVVVNVAQRHLSSLHMYFLVTPPFFSHVVCAPRQYVAYDL